MSRTRRTLWLTPSAAALRNTLLYRTLLHELGHLVDAARQGDRWDERSAREKEDFAHRHAAELYREMYRRLCLPFAPIHDRDGGERQACSPSGLKRRGWAALLRPMWGRLRTWPDARYSRNGMAGFG